ncbi:MAG: DUF1559 domain-containing protein [Planctomycetaceae bacterium]|nr:DUF1559 domain-containing protein [Planctomycetaceae bacterium]
MSTFRLSSLIGNQAMSSAVPPRIDRPEGAATIVPGSGRSAPVQSNEPADRQGFTIPELVVSLLIIAVLLSILLPVILRAHEAARRTQCQNNLKQINLAFANYHDIYNTFPPGYVSRDVQPTDAADLETGSGYAWGCLLLDYLDQTTLLAGIDFNLEPTDPLHYGIASTVLPTWTCPTDENRSAFDVDVAGQAVVLGSASYVGCYGYGSLTTQPGAPTGPGILYRNSHVPIFSIKDGSSNTIIVGERASRTIISDDQLPIDANATWYAAIPGAFRPAGIPDHPDFWEGPASLVLSTVGQDEPFPFDSLHNRTTHIGSFSSNHPDGFMAAFADTSVRFLSDKLDPVVLRHLTQHSDGVPVGEF